MNTSAVILRLYREFEHLVWFYRLPLVRPVICIQEMAGKLGEWDPAIRQIRLSERLLRDHRWDDVVEILKHEMAHQLVSEVYQVADQHGEFFQRACGRLSVAVWARRATVDIGEFVERNPEIGRPDESSDRLLRRAEKLLALANSDNENEALLAMQRVREIFARYNIERARAPMHDDYDYVVIYLNSKRIEQFQSMICNILNSFFFVKIIHSHYFDVATASELKAIELVGNRPSISMAEYVYHFLDRKLASLFQVYRKQHSLKNIRTARRSYYLGVLNGFYEKLQRQRLGDVCESGKDLTDTGSAKPSGSALILVKDPGLESFFNERYPRTRKAGWSTDYGDRHSFDAGKREGRSLTLNRPIESRGHSSGRLLR